MNNNSYVSIHVEKIAALIETDCPPITNAMAESVCNEYGDDCKECWKSWLTESGVSMNNNSYVYIPADKLVEIIKHCCPPSKSDSHTSHLARKDCLECWKSWLKDGE